MIAGSGAGGFPRDSPQEAEVVAQKSAEAAALPTQNPFSLATIARDPKDDRVLEAAVAASADYLLTFNTSDFDGGSSLGIGVITPLRLLALIPSALP